MTLDEFTYRYGKSAQAFIKFGYQLDDTKLNKNIMGAARTLADTNELDFEYIGKLAGKNTSWQRPNLAGVLYVAPKR